MRSALRAAVLFGGSSSAPGPGPGPFADILEVEVMGPSSLDPRGTGPWGVQANGWVLRVRIEATVAGPLSNLDPSKFALSVTSAGFDDAGGVITAVNQNLVFTPLAVMRQQSRGGSPDPTTTTQLMIQAGSITAAPTLGVATDYYFTLPDVIYQGDAVVVSVLDGWDGVGSTAGFAPTCTNNSTLTSATWGHPIYGFMNDPCEPVYSSTYTGVELLVAFQRSGWIGGAKTNGKMVAGVELWATDGTGDGPHIVKTSVELSTLQTRESKPEVFRVNVDLTGIDDTNGSNTLGAGMQYIDGYIYPWRGSAYQISVDGVAWPTPQPCTVLPFTKDPSKKYGGAIAYVGPTAGGSPAVSMTEAVDRAAADTVRYASINLAAAALATFFNNTGSAGRPAGAIAHNNPHGGRIILLDNAGVDQAYELTATYTPATTGNCWCDLEPYPGNTARAYYNTSVTRRFDGGLFGLNGVEVVKNAGGISANDTTGGSVATLLRAKNLSISFGTASTTPIFQNAAMGYLLNINYNGAQAPGNAVACALASANSAPYRCSKARGITLFDETVGHQASLIAYMHVGITGRFSPADPSATAGSSLQSTNDGGIFYNNKCYAFFGSIIQVIGKTWNMTRGFAVWQNTFETMSSGGCNIGASYVSAPNNDLRNIGWGFNTGVPNPADVNDDRGGFSLVYRDQTASLGHTADMIMAGNLAPRYATKSDYESVNNFAAGEGNVGNYMPKYGVGCRDNLQMINRAITIGGTEFDWRAADPGTLTNQGLTTFQSNQCTPAASWSSGAGWGDYRPAAGSNARSKIASGHAWNRYDQGGVSRLNGGTGCVGALEGV